jgi:hypothetical protein
MIRLFSIIFCAFLVAPLARTEDDVLVTLKLVKTANARANVPIKVGFPLTCGTCKVVDDPAYARQNLREVILAVRIPRSTSIRLQLSTDAAAFQRVVLETMDLAFQATQSSLSFTVPSQVADRVNSGEFQTHLYWPGVELRFEHGDPARRAGDYSSGEFPAVQRKAASNLEFGLLEAIRRLGLDHYVDDQNLGRLFLMGFDTNYPHGHLDSPPHIHLTLWLPNYEGTNSEIPHTYLTADGLISHSTVAIYKSPMPFQDYKPGMPFVAIDDLGRPIFSLTITSEGWLDIGRFDGKTCNLVPTGHGFDSGIKVSCPDFPTLTLHVDDDMTMGEIREVIDDKAITIFHYDPHTGALLQP